MNADEIGGGEDGMEVCDCDALVAEGLNNGRSRVGNTTDRLHAHGGGQHSKTGADVARPHNS